MRATLSQRRSSEKEITVKTAKGEEFRFGGISEKFTRKLYEWEEQKGIAPESSTIALLHNNNSNSCANEAEGRVPDHEAGGGEGFGNCNLHRDFEMTANILGIMRCRSEGSLRGSSGGGMRHHSSKESCGSQNSSQSLNDLDKMDNNGSVQTAFFVPDGDYASANQKSPVPKRCISECSSLLRWSYCNL